jgi:hypothetical protein
MSGVEVHRSSVIEKSELPASVVSSSTNIDLCRQYGAKPGSEATALVIEALTHALEAGKTSIDLVFSEPGVYLWDGAVQTGEAYGYIYAGQLLFPANAFTNNCISIRIRGVLPQPTIWNATGPEPAPHSGVVLLSNATSGNAFDAIPAEKHTLGPFTNLSVTFENLCICAPNNPQCGGIRGRAAIAMKTKNTVVGVNAVGDNPTYPTGGTTGIEFPAHGNNGGAGGCRAENTEVFGYARGYSYAEHMLFDNAYAQYCGVALVPEHDSGHTATFASFLAQQCPVLMEAPNSGNGGGPQVGNIDVETAAEGPFALTNMIVDPGDRLRGSLSIRANEEGWPMNVGSEYAMNHSSVVRGSVGWLEQCPWDTFTRLIYSSTIGTTDRTYHPWRALEGAWLTEKVSSSGGKLRATATPARNICRYYIHNGGSRTINATIKTGAGAYSIGIIIGSLWNGNYAYVRLTEGKVQLRKVIAGTPTVLATSAEGVVSSAGEYEVTVERVEPLQPGAPQFIRVYLNGLLVLEYELSATDITNLTEYGLAPHLQDQRKDGVWAGDTESFFTSFQVFPEVIGKGEKGNPGKNGEGVARADLALAARGLIAENFYLGLVSVGLEPTSEVIFGGVLGLFAGDELTNLLTVVTAAGVGTTPTLIRMALTNASGEVVALTGELQKSGIWTAVSEPVAAAPLESKYKAPTTGAYGVIFLQVGTWGTTALKLGRAASVGTAYNKAYGSAKFGAGGSFGSEQKSLPAVGNSLAVAAQSNFDLWFGVA